MSELLQLVKPEPEFTAADYKTRWNQCARHDEEFLEILLPNFEFWHAPKGCPRCKQESDTGKLVPRIGQSLAEFRLELAGLPERLRDKTLEDFQGKEFQHALDVARSFVTGDNCVLIGPFGSGRSSFACALLNQFAAVGSIQFQAAASLRARWAYLGSVHWEDGAFGQGLAETLTALSEPDFLVVDDVEDLRTAEECSWLQRAVALRHAHGRSTIVIAQDLETFTAVLGPRTLDTVRGWKLINLDLGKES